MEMLSLVVFVILNASGLLLVEMEMLSLVANVANKNENSCLWLYMMHVPLQMLSLVKFIAEIFEVQCYCY
jgi:hypothetical protein